MCTWYSCVPQCLSGPIQYEAIDIIHRNYQDAYGVLYCGALVPNSKSLVVTLTTVLFEFGVTTLCAPFPVTCPGIT